MNFSLFIKILDKISTSPFFHRVIDANVILSPILISIAFLKAEFIPHPPIFDHDLMTPVILINVILAILFGDQARWPLCVKLFGFYRRTASGIAHSLFRKPALWASGFFIYQLCAYGVKALDVTTSSGLDTVYYMEASQNAFAPIPLYSHLCTCSLFAGHFSAFLYFLYPLTQLPFSNLIFYSVEYLALSLVLYFGLKMVAKLDVSVLMKAAVVIAACTASQWYGLMSFEFHDMAFVPLFSLLVFWAIYRHSYGKFIVFLVILLSLRETVSFSVLFAGFVLLIYFRKAYLRYSLIMIGFSLIVIASYYGFIHPSFSSGSIAGLDHYKHLAKDIRGFLLAPFINFDAWYPALFNISNAKYLLFITLPFLPFWKRGLKMMVFALPTLYLLLLGYRGIIRWPRLHYGGELVIPLALIGYIGVMQGFKNTSRAKEKLIFAWVVCWYFAMQVTHPLNEISRPFVSLSFYKDNLIYIQELHKIPREASVLAPVPLIPFLLPRENVSRGLGNIPDPDYVVTVHNHDSKEIIETIKQKDLYFELHDYQIFGPKK